MFTLWMVYCKPSTKEVFIPSDFFFLETKVRPYLTGCVSFSCKQHSSYTGLNIKYILTSEQNCPQFAVLFYVQKGTNSKFHNFHENTKISKKSNFPDHKHQTLSVMCSPGPTSLMIVLIII